MSNTYDLVFPRVIAHHERNDLIDPVLDMLQEIPVVDGWDSIASVDDRILDKYPKIQKQFTDEVHGFLKNVMEFDCGLQMTTSWFTKVHNGLTLQAHKHMNSWYSAVFYFQNDCEIKILADNATQIYVVPNQDRKNNFADETITYQPKPGTILIFPSNTLHQIEPHDWAKTRYSLAFNFMPLGEVGRRDSRHIYK